MKQCTVCSKPFRYPPSDNKADATKCAWCAAVPNPDKNLVNEGQSIPLTDRAEQNTSGEMQNKASSCSQIVIPKDKALKACPFCGGVTLKPCSDDGLFWTRCTNCGATGPEVTKYSGEEGDPFIDWNTRSSDASDIEDAVEQEQGRWQDAIRDKVIKASQIPNADSWVDGAGCDSGDPLDVTLAEIGQVIHYLVDELAELRSDASKEAPKIYHCSCRAACTADEYIDHLFRGHDAMATDASKEAERQAAFAKANYVECDKRDAEIVRLQAEIESLKADGYVRGLEDAAKVCDRLAKQNVEASVRAIKRDDWAGHDILDSCKREAEAAASLIRALISQHSPEVKK